MGLSHWLGTNASPAWGGALVLSIMATQLDIINSALANLGCMPLVSPTDTSSKEANLSNAYYPTCRDYVLREHPWKSCIKRVSLSPLYSPPAPTDSNGNALFNPNRVPLCDPNSLRHWQYAIQLPTDYIGLVLTDDDKLPFQMEGKTFLTNEQTVVMRYVWRATPDYFDPHLCEAISAYLAKKLAMPLVQNTQIFTATQKDYALTLAKAKFHDSRLSRPITQNEYYYEDARMQANHI